LRKRQRLDLDLGNVKDLAKITLNGKVVGVLWKPPYGVDVISVLKAGRNTLEIGAANEWTNRIAEDRQLPPGRFSTIPYLGKFMARCRYCRAAA